MKKFLVYFCGLMLCMAVGCKKDSNSNKILLLKNRVTDDRVEGHPLDTTTYEYDDQNRITAITDGPPSLRTSFSITYNSDGSVNIARKYNKSGALIIEFDFYYTPGATGYYFHGGGNLGDTAIFTFNDKKQLTKIQNGHSGSQLFTYDSRGNVVTSDAFGADGSNNLFDNITYAYDNARNPFSQTAPNNYFFMFVAYTDPSTLINNVQVRDGDTYTYTYNNEGFPIKAIVSTGTAQIPIYYNYMLK